MILLGLLMGTFLSIIGGGEDIPGMGGMGGMGASIGIVYIVLALLYLYPCVQLFKFSKLAKQAIIANNTEQMTMAFGHMKSMFKFIGIFTIIMLGIYALILLGGARLVILMA